MIGAVAARPKSNALSALGGTKEPPMSDPDPEHLAAISDGVERALTRLFNSPDITDAIRQGVRDGIWHLGTEATHTPPAGHAN
jgi:hypothetical protein